MKRIIFLFILTIVMAAAQAQPPMPENPDMPTRPMRHGHGARPPHPPFDPVKFEKELEQFIVTEAALTPSESAKFFPVYREMRKKQIAYFGNMQRNRFVDTSDNKACERAIREADQRDLDLKLLQREYHEKFMVILSPAKAMKVIRAEEKFHRQIFRKAARRDAKR